MATIELRRHTSENLKGDEQEYLTVFGVILNSSVVLKSIVARARVIGVFGHVTY